MKVLFTAFSFAIIVGLVACLTAGLVILLDLASGAYGGITPVALMCTIVPGGVLGMVVGFIWYRLIARYKSRRNSGYTLLDVIALIPLGFIVGSLPFACLKLSLSYIGQ